MSILSKHLIRYGVALLGTAVVADCSSGGDGGTEPVAITLALNPTSASIQQGESAAVTGTLTRSGGTGTVNLTVTGAPTGVTAVVSNLVTTGLVTTATIIINVDAAATPGGASTLTVHGTGSGVTEATATFALTITAAPAPEYGLTLSAPALAILQGNSAPTTVNITRVNFTGEVALSVLNLPTGVSAAFAPVNPQTGNSAVLTLTVVAGAPTGTFTNLSVQGVGTPGTVATPLSLTISVGTPAGNFTLTTTPSGYVSVTQGTSTQVTVNVVRTGGFIGAVALTAPTPSGFGLSFLPTSTTTDSSGLTITAVFDDWGGVAPVGAYPIVIHGNAAGLGEQLVSLIINVMAPGGSGNPTPPENFTLSTTPSGNVSVPQGSSTQLTVNIVRTGGFTGAVALTALPAWFLPTSTTTNSAVLTITAEIYDPVDGDYLASVGTYATVIHGNAAGLGEQLVSLTINVVAPGGSGNVTLSLPAAAPGTGARPRPAGIKTDVK